MSDPDQKSTYAAEDLVAEWLDAASSQGGEVTVTLKHGGAPRTVTYQPETEPLFSEPKDAIGFVELVRARLRVQADQFGSNYRDREFKPVTVREGRGFTKATYRDGFIFLPTREAGGAWALRGLVVLHELAHHLNTGVDGTIIDHHGQGFRDTFVKILEDIGWTETASMLRDAYREIGLGQHDSVDDGMLAKVGKLLRHAEGASTEAERDAFFSKAQELATAHSIELAVARAAHEKGEAELSPTFEQIRLGHRGQHSNVRFIALMLAIARVNDLRCSIQGDNTGVNLFGFRGDIEVAKALYASLVIQMVADADAYIRSGAHRPVHGRTARAAFYQGWTGRIGQRLAEAKQYATKQATSSPTPAAHNGQAGSTSTALALKAKEVEVDDYYESMKRQQGIRGVWRGGSRIDDARSAARGRAAANRARLGSEKSLAP